MVMTPSKKVVRDWICSHPDSSSSLADLRPSLCARIILEKPQIPGSTKTDTVASIFRYLEILPSHPFMSLLLIKDFGRHNTFQMREFIRHVRNLHGLHELLLEVLLHC